MTRRLRPLAVLLMVTTTVAGLAADSANVYWATSYALYSMPIEGGMRRLIASADLMAPFGGPIAAYGGRAYLLATGNKILSVPAGGGSPEVVASGLEFTSGLAADGTGVYWSKPNPGGIWRSHGDANSNELLASGIENPIGIAVDSDGIYWGTLAGSVMRIPKQGGASAEVASGASHDLAVASYGPIYAVENSTETRLMLSPRDGGGRVRAAGVQRKDEWDRCRRAGHILEWLQPARHPRNPSRGRSRAGCLRRAGQANRTRGGLVVLARRYGGLHLPGSEEPMTAALSQSRTGARPEGAQDAFR